MALSKAVREAVWKRASGLCERIKPDGKRCLAPGAEFHHIILKGMGGRKGEMKKWSDSEENIALVCLMCHRRIHDGH